MCAEDREDLRMFEEGVSSPTPMHTAWSAAASSLQMRHALPEVSTLTPNTSKKKVEKMHNKP